MYRKVKVLIQKCSTKNAWEAEERKKVKVKMEVNIKKKGSKVILEHHNLHFIRENARASQSKEHSPTTGGEEDRERGEAKKL